MRRWRGGSWLWAGLLGSIVFLAAGCTVGSDDNNWTTPASQGAQRVEKFSQSFPVGTVGSLSLKTGPGEVVVTSWGQDTIGVDVEKRAAGADQAAVQAFLDGVRIEATPSGQALQVTTVTAAAPPPGVKFTGVSYLIRVPASLKGTLNLETDRATVRLSNLRGEATLKVRQADAEVRDFTGRLAADVDGGQVTLQRVEGDLEVKANGPVEITEARLRAKARVETANARLTIGLAELGVGQYDFLTSNAPVRLTVPYGAAARFRVATTNGRVFDELPLTWIDRNETDAEGIYRFEGWLNAGGAQVNVATTNADVNLGYR
ncbi:MAG: hypothetical protein ACM3RP_09360 [Chitinophagales bacterium]